MAGDGLAVTRRLHTIRRIVEVKRQQCRATDWALARLKRDEQALLDEERAIVEALNADQPLHGLFMETMARHLRAVAGKLEAVRQEAAAEQLRQRTQKGQLRQAERMLAEAERQERRAAESKELTEIVEMTAARGAASLP
jgi:5,10-methylene-tetrahydrofolate dehydrogenase/methenyl tetrahydrofolate cyclohydrolase